MRCYNGCPDKELKAKLDEISSAERKLKRLNPEACCTYHHPTGIGDYGWHVHIWGVPISKFYNDKILALNEAKLHQGRKATHMV